MKTKLLLLGIFTVLVIAKFGFNPFSKYRDTSGVLASSYYHFETGVKRQANGVYLVRALTRMPEVKAQMVKWWFADYMQTTEHYKRWHPKAHIWMDWENKTPGKIVGASHLVHEYLGQSTQLHKLRIQFVDPSEFLDEYEEEEGKFVICARAGDLEAPLNYTTLCHAVKDTEFGAEMRSVFWLGHVEKRKGNDTIYSIEGLFGNSWIARHILLDEEFAIDLMTHAIEEMGILADFLPELYLNNNRPTN